MSENEIINQNVQILEDSNNITIEETIEVIDVTDATSTSVDSFEAFPAIGEGNEEAKHPYLNGRELPDQHPITAITGLREELNEIERFKTVYSDKANIANYYEWGDGAHDDYGYFVSLIPNTTTVKICDGSDILGVTVESAGFVGGENQNAPRDNRYCLVVTSGLVGVRCEGDVQVGDCITSNDYGVAERVYNAYGYEVMALKDIGGTTYAIIDLKVQIRKVRALASAVDVLDRRVSKSERDIVAAINVAQEAYNKASEAGGIVAGVVDKVDDAITKVDSNVVIVGNLEQRVESALQSSSEAKSIAETAAVSAEAIRNEAVKTANESLANINDLIKDLEPLTTWEDPETKNTGAEYLTNYIENGLATKAEIYTVETLTEDNKSSIEKNAEMLLSLVTSVDKYSVGEYSQSYGLTYKQAESILKEGIVYIPTKHSDTRNHSETFEDTGAVNEFTPGGYYEWQINDQNQYDWVEYGNSVAFFSEEPSPSRALRYWYIDSKEAPEGYEPYALYAWIDEKWTKVNIYYNNPNNRMVSSISQEVDSISLEVVNARGSMTSISERLDADAAKVDLLTEWQDTIGTSMANINLTADDIGASIAQIVRGVGNNGEVTAGSIILAINNQTVGSSATINASNINFEGFATFVRPGDLGAGGTTTIDGSRITTGVIQSHGYDYKPTGDDIFATTGTAIDLDTGCIRSKEFVIDGEGNAHFKGEINVGGNFIVDPYGNVTLNGDITWGTGNGPKEPAEIYHLYYISQSPDPPPKPTYNGTSFPDWSISPYSVTEEWPYQYFSQCTIKDGVATCTDPVLWVKYLDTEFNDEAIFQILTDGGNKCGIFSYDGGGENPQIYISAESIKTGTLYFNAKDAYGTYCFDLDASNEDDMFVNLPLFNVMGNSITIGKTDSGSAAGMYIASTAGSMFMYGTTNWGGAGAWFTEINNSWIRTPSLSLKARVGTWELEEEIDVYDAIVKLIERVEALEGGCAHTWDDGEITTDPTCTQDGVKTYTCIKCGETKETTIPAGHDYNSDHICNVCGAKDPNSGSGDGGDDSGGGGEEPSCEHLIQSQKFRLEATCTEDGHEAGYQCQQCGKWLSGGDTIPATGHDMQETTPQVDATCTTDGKTAVYTCANGCGHTEGGEVIEKLGHTELVEKEAAVAPTCTTTGKTAVMGCENCDDINEGGDVVSKLAHKYMWHTVTTYLCGTQEQEYRCINGCNDVQNRRTLPGSNCTKNLDGECMVCGRPM